MNNIEKLDDVTVLIRDICEMEPPSESDVLAVTVNIDWLESKFRELLDERAKALQQSSEPVGHVVDTPNMYGAVLQQGLKHETLLFTHPPASVPLEKYNKLLDALKEILTGWNADVIDAEESMLKIDAEIKAIAEAEGKEG